MTIDIVDSDRPTRNRMIILVLVAATVHAAFFIAAASFSHLTWSQQAHFGDSDQYVRYGQAIAGHATTLSEYDKRLFFGAPLAIAGMIRVGIPGGAAAVLQSWAGSCIAVAASAYLFESVTIGLAVALLLPDYLLVSSVVASEGLMLGLTTAGLAFARRRKQIVLGGLLLGAAGVVRPMACFAVIGYAAAEVSEKRYRNAIVLGLSSLAVVLLGMAAMRYFTGDALESLHVYRDHPTAYDGHLLDWPMHAIIHYSTHYPIDKSKLLYVWVNVVFLVVALAALAAGPRAGTSLGRLSLVWAAGNSLLCVCLGSAWAYLCFPRFICGAEPALLFGVRRFLPPARQWWAWLLIGGASFAVALMMIVRRQGA